MSGQGNREEAFRADRLDAEIRRRRLTNDEVGRLADMPEKTIRRWRKGEVEPRARNLRRLAQVLDVDLGWFYEEPEQEAAA